MNLTTRIAIFFIILFSISPCHAQLKIKLQDVARFEFIRKGGGMSNYNYHLEVVPEAGNWRSYQTQLTTPGRGKERPDYPRTYVKDVSIDTLKNLLDKLAQPVTEINLKLFNLNNAELINDLDSIGISFKPGQKADLVKAIQSNEVVNRAVYQMLHPMPMDDKDYYAIKITLKTNETLTVDTRSFAYPYDLPWSIGFVTSYDPAISNIFNEITGHPNYNKAQHKRFLLNIDRYIYREYMAKNTANSN